MSRWLVAATVIWLAGMLALAQPRRVGDASEYVAMASQFADGRGAALSEADLRAFTARHAPTAAAFELETRRITELRGRDGRYDMPHMWVYPLLAVPGVWVTSVLHVSPAWAFVTLNTACLGGLLWLAAARGAGAWTLLLAASPLVWWLDKPLADLFVAASLGTAVLLWPRHGPVSLAVLGLAAAQNPALVAPCVIFATAAAVENPARVRDRRWWAGALLGATLAAMAPAYYCYRLDRLSPLTSWTAASWPSVSSLLFPLADIDMGAVIRFPPGALMVGLVLLRRSGWRAPAATPAALTAIALLAIVSQQPNMNQGGNPDFSRYAVWLLPLALPWLLDADHSRRLFTRNLGAILLGVSVVWTAVSFLPTRPESYRYPTPMAAWMWTRHPTWTMPRPEAFGERTSHREPAIVPTATPGCEKVLLFEGRWPANCPPSTSPPPACEAPGAYCYADRVTGVPGVPRQFTVMGRQPEHGAVVSDRTWRSGESGGSWLESRVRHLSSGEEPSAPAHVRGTWGSAWTQAWSSDRALVVYVRDAGSGARVAIRNPEPLLGLIETSDGRVVRRLTLEATTDTPAVLELPAAPHVLVSLWRQP